MVVKGVVGVQRKKLARKGLGPVAKPTASQVCFQIDKNHLLQHTQKDLKN